MGADHSGKPAPARDRMGALLIDKPAGITSHQVVQTLRKLTRIKKVGHTGTLDPFATGLLPVLLGKTTRLSRFLTESTKAYLCVVDLSYATDTYDIEGKKSTPVFTSYPARESIERLLKSFVGTGPQVPPMFSAKKVKGEKLYNLARKGVEIPRDPVDVTISGISLLSYYDRYLTMLVRCSMGTYMRSLAHDIGRELGGGAHLSCLRRIETGGFHIKNAVALHTLERLEKPGNIRRYLIPPEKMLVHYPSLTLSDRGEADFSHGRPVQGKDVLEKAGRKTEDASTYLRVFNARNVLLGLAERPVKKAGGADRVFYYQPAVVLGLPFPHE